MGSVVKTPMSPGFVMRVPEYCQDDDGPKTESFVDTERLARYNQSRKEADRKIALDYKRILTQEDKLGHEVEEKVVVGRFSTLALESRRMKKLRQLKAMNQLLKSHSIQGFSHFEKDIATLVKQIRGTKETVTAKLDEIVKTFSNPCCPLSISTGAFAKALMASSASNPFASCYVVVQVTSRFPSAMDILLAEFHRACSYTVPRHDVNSEFGDNNDAYRRLDSVMRLYGALVQTHVPGVTNSHGIEHGLTWLARFFTDIPANDRASATALNAFLQTAGYELHQRYKSHFLKVVNVVRDYVANLRAGEDSSHLQMILTQITVYLDGQEYLKEPQGTSMET